MCERKFLTERQDRIFAVIRADAQKYIPDGKGIVYTYIKRPIFRYVYWLRIVSLLKRENLKKYTLAPVAYCILKHYEYKYGIHVNTNTIIGKGLYIEHGDGVYLNVHSIGENFSVFQGVTLGASTTNGLPTVGNNVTVYMGAKVFGELTLGDNCVVGANAVVTKSVEKNSVVVGVPARKIKSIFLK